jgi:hypothetical protein
MLHSVYNIRTLIKSDYTIVHSLFPFSLMSDMTMTVKMWQSASSWYRQQQQQQIQMTSTIILWTDKILRMFASNHLRIIFETPFEILNIILRLPCVCVCVCVCARARVCVCIIYVCKTLTFFEKTVWTWQRTNERGLQKHQNEDFRNMWRNIFKLIR